LSRGYIAGIIDEIRSLSRCAPLSARRMGNSGRCVTLASMVMQDPLNVELDRVKVQGLHN
jgi:hypothetical protein